MNKTVCNMKLMIEAVDDELYMETLGEDSVYLDKFEVEELIEQLERWLNG